MQAGQSDPSRGNGSSHGEMSILVLKVTSIHSRQQRDIAEKEAKLLSRLSHPSIIKMYDACYRTAPGPMGIAERLVGGNKDGGAGANGKDGRPQHMILMEYCEGGHALDVCNKLAAAGQRFDLSALIIAFGQICNAVSYLHAQRPPIVHRDLKPVNFLVKNGAYKLCDFGSAVFGHVELKTQRARAEAEEVIQKTTTQMFRAPEMVDLYMAKKLTQTTDVWALGCCLYSLAFLQNCFEEGSNLAILSRNFKIPDDNPYGDGLAELLDRMLTVECKARADMTEVILCLSAIYSGKPLPPRKKPSKSKKAETGTEVQEENEDDKEERVGTYRTTGQGVYTKKKTSEQKKPAEVRILDRITFCVCREILTP
jgi:serine/threonine protein kinase